MSVSPQLLKILGLSSFIAFDFETTGLELETDQIIEIGAVRWEDGQEVDSFSTLVKPRGDVSPRIFKLTGIEPSRLKRAPGISKVFPGFDEFMADTPIVAHNLEFDLNFYTVTADRLDKPAPDVPDNYRFDTLRLVKFILPGLPNHRLGTVCSELGIDLDQAHRAVHDARATGTLLLKLVQIASTFDDQLLAELALLTEGTDSWAERFIKGLQQYRREVGTEECTPCFQTPVKTNVIQVHATGTAGNDETTIREYFGNKGKLAAMLGDFHEREEQIALAEEVEESCERDTFLVAQAGTGIGKSYAYLYPAVRHAVSKRQRFVISTHTRNLQEQIFTRDLPDLLRGLNADFKAVLLKGRHNYICRQRWESLLANRQEKLHPSEWEKLLPVAVWLHSTKTGDIEECSAFHHRLNPGLWTKLRSEALFCNGGKCRQEGNGCYLTHIRRQAQNCDMAIINHSLLLSDVTAAKGILGDYSHLVIDEGHNLMEAAERQLKSEFSFRQMKMTLNSLFLQDAGERGALVQARGEVTFAELSDSRQAVCQEALQKAIDAVSKCAAIVGQVRSDAIAANREAHSRKLQELKFTLKRRFKQEDSPLAVHHQALGQLQVEGIALLQDLAELLLSLEEDEAEHSEDYATLLGDISTLREQLRDQLNLLETIAGATEPDVVYWEEVHPRSLESTYFACPLSIADQLREQLYTDLKQLVVLSATITVDNNFDYFLEQTGLDKPPRPLKTKLFGSPFDYENQVRFLVPQYFPDATRVNDQFVSQLADLVESISVRRGIGTMILFTSYQLLNRTYSELIERIDYHRTPVLGQGLDGTREAILDRFRKARNGILLGTESFWQGVDIPGPALELLIITKLPFAVPSEPMIKARYDKVEAEGRNSFMCQAVPAAVLKFQQGFGRLIRSEADRGMVILLDRRVAVKKYGSIFTSSVEATASVIFQEEMMEREIDDFFGSGHES